MPAFGIREELGRSVRYPAAPVVFLLKAGKGRAPVSGSYRLRCAAGSGAFLCAAANDRIEIVSRGSSCRFCRSRVSESHHRLSRLRSIAM